MADEEKKAVGPVILGKMPGGEKSAFLRYTMVEGDDDPVLVTQSHQDAQSDQMQQELSGQIQQAASAAAAQAAEHGSQSGADAGKEAGEAAGKAAGEEAGRKVGSESGATAGKAAGEKAVADAPAKTRAPAGFTPAVDLDFATKSYVDAQLKKMNESLVKLGIKLPSLFG